MKRRDHSRAGTALGSLAIAILAVGLSACGAPASQPATGPVAADVESALRSGSATFDHSVWGELLAGGTRVGLVDYPYFQSRRSDLDGYLERIAENDLASLASAELKALLINAYNALTLRSILDNPTVSSIRDIDGVWTEIRHRVGGHELTLDNIEHNLLRPFFRDPRIHFAVNCASMSCAPLPVWPFTGDRLDEQLEERTRAFLTSEANVRVEGGGLAVSKYFEWYGEDFVSEGWEPRAATIGEFIGRYSRPEVTRAVEASGPDLPISFLDYDWSLNAALPPDPAVGPPAGSASGERGVVGWLRDWVDGFGPVAPLMYGLAYTALVVLLVPGGALTIGAGVVFGLGLGTVVVTLAANVGAALAFLIARYLLRGRVEGWLESKAKLGAIDRAVATQGWRVVALTRLSPVFPFNVQNYFYGLTGVPFWQYAAASLPAMFPGTLLYIYIGVVGTEVAAALTGAASWGRMTLEIAGLAATLLVVILITRMARRELDRVTSAGNGSGGGLGGSGGGGSGGRSDSSNPGRSQASAHA